MVLPSCSITVFFGCMPLSFLPSLAQGSVYLHKFPAAFPVATPAFRPANAPLIGKEATAEILKGAVPPPFLLKGLDLLPMLLRERLDPPDFFGVPVAVDGQGVIDQRVVVIKGRVRRRVHS